MLARLKRRRIAADRVEDDEHPTPMTAQGSTIVRVASVSVLAENPLDLESSLLEVEGEASIDEGVGLDEGSPKTENNTTFSEACGVDGIGSGDEGKGDEVR